MISASDFDFKEINCPVCQETKTSFVGWRGGEAHHDGAGVKTRIVRCSNCTHQYPNPMPFPKEGIDALYRDASAYFTGQESEQKKQAGRARLHEFESKLRGKGRFLDVGCGVGEVVSVATEMGWEATGVEPSTEFTRLALERFSLEITNSTLEDAGFPDNSFDAIALSSVIEHLYSPLDTLKEIARVLRPGGLLWLDAPNEDGLYMKFGNFYLRLQGKEWVIVMAPTFPPYHVQGFNPKSISAILKNADLSLKSIETLGGLPLQTGAPSLKKSLENIAAKLVSSTGNILNKGLYMSIWVEKE